MTERMAMRRVAQFLWWKPQLNCFTTSEPPLITLRNIYYWSCVNINCSGYFVLKLLPLSQRETSLGEACVKYSSCLPFSHHSEWSKRIGSLQTELLQKYQTNSMSDWTLTSNLSPKSWFFHMEIMCEYNITCPSWIGHENLQCSIACL